MAEALKTAFYKKLEVLRATSALDDLFEALGLAVVLRVTGELDDLPAADRQELLRIGRKQVLAAPFRVSSKAPSLVGQSPTDPPQTGLRGSSKAPSSGGRSPTAAPQTGFDDEDRAYALAIARAGLNALSGKREFDAALGDRTSPPPSRLLDMLRGEPDGLSAAACAIRVATSAADRAKLDVLRFAREPERLRVAAQEEEPVRDPSAGRLVGVLERAKIEAVLFGDRELALYSAADDVLRVEAEGAITMQMLPGYWLGRVAPDVHRVRATIELGDERIEWSIDLA